MARPSKPMQPTRLSGIDVTHRAEQAAPGDRGDSWLGLARRGA
jgi:hypothetical protein